jgi:RNA polymerase sigma-70 factor (sigma-E family)
VVQGVVQGVRDEAGFEAFATANGRRLRHAARLLTGDPQRAEDLLQTALARTYLRWGRIRSDDPVAYVRRVLYSAHADSWRRRWRDEYPTAEPPDRPAAGDHASEAAERDRLRSALATLSPRERAVVVLRYYEDLGERQTADALGIAVGTVKSTCNRALAKLRLSPDLAEAKETR